MINKLRHKVIAFLDSKKEIPILAALAASLYPLGHYYNTNFTLINSWSQFFFFLISFIIIPIISFSVLYRVFKKTPALIKYSPYVIPILNLCVFAFLIVISTYGFKKKILALALFIALVLGILLKKHIKKIIVFQFILSGLVLAKLIPDFYKHITYSNAWIEQPDSIEEVVFKKRPNVYIIQPDGYANFSELKGSNYNYDNSSFETFLTNKNFKLYNGFRSNYFSTLSSNSSMFAMKHHYFNSPKPKANELYNSRNLIVGENPVVSIFNKNNYKTSLILEKQYLLVNRPTLGYDFCNISYNEISYLARGFSVNKNVIDDLESAILDNKDTSNFYFIEKIAPGHINTTAWGSDGKEQERLDYLKSLDIANTWLTKIISTIEAHDKNGLIVIVADHGGFVGMDYTIQSKEKQTDRDVVYSIFTSALAIKWTGEAPDFDDKLKTNINLFRVLFSYLSEDKTYLDNLQDDSSFAVIEKGAPFGVYQLIDENGNVVFNRFSK